MLTISDPVSPGEKHADCTNRHVTTHRHLVVTCVFFPLFYSEKGSFSDTKRESNSDINTTAVLSYNVVPIVVILQQVNQVFSLKVNRP